MSDTKDITAGRDHAFEHVLKVAFELNNASRHADAEAICRVLLRIKANDAQLLFLLGMVLNKLGRSGEALKYLEQAAVLEPRSARIFNGLAFVHQSLKDFDRAREYYERAIALGLNVADAYYSLGNACHQLDDIERAAEMFQKAVDLKPQDVECLNNLGKCLCDLGRLEESIAVYDRAIAINPTYPMARYGRTMAMLGAGHLREGLVEYNEWRHHGIPKRVFPQPVWNGEPIPGKTLFLYAEQGYGDAFMHARFLKQARECAGRVILECRPGLKTFFAHSQIADEVIDFGEKIPPFDYYTSLPSLAGIFGVTLETIPSEVPYLKAGSGVSLPEPGAGRRSESSEHARLKRVGLVWSGNPEHHNDRARSLRLEMLAPLFAVPDVAFYSLQQAVRPVDETAFQNAGMIDLRNQLSDFVATSALISQLDLVITVDSAVAHLAAALGQPVWLLVAFVSDWRWLRNRTDTPWYPTMRLFRQTKRGEWAPVVAEVAKELERLGK